ncbi:MAG: hypothetical protein NTX22_15630 [Ignavibacteriales bacterium]|nr:hypothetical protein [Ignavibacteriales bacterium]
MNNAIEYPEAWKIFVDCVRKFPDNKSIWVYGIPNPQNKNSYLYSDCPGKLFNNFKNLFYKSPQEEIAEFYEFINWLEWQEGKKGKK